MMINLDCQSDWSARHPRGEQSTLLQVSMLVMGQDCETHIWSLAPFLWLSLALGFLDALKLTHHGLKLLKS